MKKSTAYFFFFFLFLTSHLKAQEGTEYSFQPDKFSIGLGIGQDYGGFGGHAIVYPQQNIGLFAGLGYNLAGFGYNVGFKLRLVSQKPTTKVNPYAVLMYGYTAAIMIQDASQYDKIFYGPTIGFGIDLKSNPSSKIYYSFGINFPVRGTEVDDYMADLKKNHGVVFKNDLFPITFSLGFKYILN